jgi:tetratricopeptide (TPR) repeat protein
MTDAFDRGKAFRLFVEALALEEPARAQFLRDRIGVDAPLRAEIDALLAAAAADSGHSNGLLSPATPHIEDLVGRQFGRFRLVELIGQGGMGVVYRAERTDGIVQTVAVKLIGNDLAKTGQDRFKRETLLLARLEHPAIARLIDAGIEAGRAWIAMEFVAGRPIDEYCEEHRLPLRARVRLLAELAGAVAAAHRMLVVHRDIKPANVLVNADGVPKLIDFGIAAALQDQSAWHAQTADLGRLFTPHYAAPEQVTGEPVTVTTDVFGLGALGYRLLTGQTLYPEAHGAIGYLLAVTQRDVDPPSRVLNAADPRAARSLRGDLDAILRKALEREPSKRYASAADLQADLQRYLDDVPVVARPPSAAVRIGKFARRNAVAVSLASVSGAALILGLVAYGLQARQAAEARETAARRGEFLQDLLKSANPRGGNREVTVAMLLDGSATQIEHLVDTEPLVGASMLGLVAESNLGLGRYPEGLAASAREIELLRAHGGTALDLADALALRGELLIHAGRDLDAETPLHEALGLVEHRRGAAKQLAAALEGLAKATQDLGREAEAEALYRREIDVYRSSGIDFGGQAGFPLSGLATLRHDQGRYAEAAAYMEQALEIERRKFPPDHPDLLDAEYNYAVTLEQAGRAIQAEPVFRKLLASYRRILGPDHSDTYGAQQGLAHDLLSQKRYQDAADEALPAAQGLSRTLGDSDDWTLTAWSVYGTSACLAGHGDEGLAALRKVAAVRVTQRIADDWREVSARVQIGSCLVALGRYADAEPLLQQSVPILEALRGPTSERTQAGFRALRDLYANTGRLSEAAVLQKKMLPARQ